MTEQRCHETQGTVNLSRIFEDILHQDVSKGGAIGGLPAQLCWGDSGSVSETGAMGVSECGAAGAHNLETPWLLGHQGSPHCAL